MSWVKTFQSLVLKVVKAYKKLVYVWLMWYTDPSRNHGMCVCVLFLNCGEGGYHVPWSQCVCAVSTAGCPCSHHGGEKGGGWTWVTGVWQFHAACGLQMCWQFDSWQVVTTLQSTAHTPHPPCRSCYGYPISDCWPFKYIIDTYCPLPPQKYCFVII